MSDQRRITEIYVNMDDSVLVDSNGSIQTTVLPLFRRSQTLFRCHLQLRDGSAFVTPVGAQWVFIIDDSYDPDHADLVVSDNVQFNVAGDWTLTNPLTGLITWRVNTATTQLTADIGSAASKAMTAELWMLPSGGDPTLVVQFPVLIKNIVGDVGADAGLIYVSTNMLKWDGNDIVLYFSDGTVAQRWSRV